MKDLDVMMTQKWTGDFVSIYLMRDKENVRQPILLFYAESEMEKKDPHFKQGEVLKLSKVIKSGFYKKVLFSTTDQIPTDVVPDLSF